MSERGNTVPAEFHTVTPYLTVKDATSAIEFYKKAFGAVERYRLTFPGGVIAHAEITIGESIVMLSEENADWGTKSPRASERTPVAIALYVDDSDAIFAQAVAAGAQAEMPVSDQFYGDRSGRLIDPYGHSWMVSTHKEDVSPSEMQKRFEAMLATPGNGPETKS